MAKIKIDFEQWGYNETKRHYYEGGISPKFISVGVQKKYGVTARSLFEAGIVRAQEEFYNSYVEPVTEKEIKGASNKFGDPYYYNGSYVDEPGRRKNRF